MLIGNEDLIKPTIVGDGWRYPFPLYVRNLHIESLLLVKHVIRFHTKGDC